MGATHGSFLLIRQTFIIEMQPFLPAKRIATMLSNTRHEDGTGETAPMAENHALHAAADDLIRAVHAKDTKAVADAIEACIYACEDEGQGFGEND